MINRKIYKTLIIVVLSILLSATAIMTAQSASIVGSRHDLHNYGTDARFGIMWAANDYNDYGEVCVYCHTPHSADSSSSAPLWNRTMPTGPYTPYGSPTINTSIPGMPNSESLACLSCHDGTISIDSIRNMPGSGLSPSGTMGDLNSWTNSWSYGQPSTHGKLSTAPVGPGLYINCASGCHNPTTPGQGVDFRAGALSTDLSDDHPISMPYPTTEQDPDFNSPGDVVTAGLKLFGSTNTVECSSCHSVHDPAIKPFLRKSNTGSQLCYTCHTK
jgi:predicted CXXCH cytochrome family protein